MAFGEKPFKIDGGAIPTPSEYGFDIEDLSSEETGRTLDGVMHKDVIDDKDTYTCTWKKLSWEDTAFLLARVNKKTKVNFTHADPRVPGRFITHPFYVGKRSCKAVNLNDPKNTWGEISFSFIRI